MSVYQRVSCHEIPLNHINPPFSYGLIHFLWGLTMTQRPRLADVFRIRPSKSRTSALGASTVRGAEWSAEISGARVKAIFLRKITVDQGTWYLWIYIYICDRIFLTLGNFRYVRVLFHILPSKLLHNYGKSPFLRGRSTISMAIITR